MRRKSEQVDGIGPWASRSPRGNPFLHPHGFTLVELLVVVAIAGIVMGGIYTVFVRSNRLYIAQEKVVSAQQEARSALEILGREIRMAGLISSENGPDGTDPITVGAWGGGHDSTIEVASVNADAKTTTLAFKSDLDGDGNTDAVRYVYYHSNHATVSRRKTLTRRSSTWIGGAWVNDSNEQVFLENIQNLIITYQLVDGTSTPNPAGNEDNIRGVIVRLTAQTDNAVEPYEGGKGVRTRQLVSHIQIRNMGFS